MTGTLLACLLLPTAEGIALGVPIFFATGSKWKAIAWAAASGLSEPLGALIGLALQLTGHLDPTAMGM
jgi:ZIP family zinc transporter